MSEILHFKTNTLLKNLVGKDLINDDNIAVVELVKNSYDAMSSSVLVKFEELTEEGKTTEASRLFIVDHGKGMDEDDIEDKWLNIAYSEKKIRGNKNGAFLAGNKGIGRFSCDRLGKYLVMLTRVRNGKLLHLKIDWPEFETEGNKDLTIQEIDVFLSEVTENVAKEISGMNMPVSGTMLIISELRSVWDKNKYFDLKRMLERFLNPNQLFQRHKFKIELSVPDLKGVDEKKEYQEKINGVIKNQIFDKLKFNTTYIESTIGQDGKTINTELYHEGEKVFSLLEINRDYPNLKHIHVVIYYLNPYKKAYFKRQTGIRSIDFGSIFFFLNGFRVAPYGDRSDDWLGIDVRKSQGTARYLSSRDIIGRIEVVDRDENFVPISSREGLKNSTSFVELKKNYFLGVLRNLERFVVDGLGWDSIPTELRQILRVEEGMDWKDTVEQYSESWDKKRQRIALSIMTLIGATPTKAIKFWFNPSLLDGLHEQRSKEITDLISGLEGFEEGQIERDLKINLKKVTKLLSEKDKELKSTKEEATKLKVKITDKNQKIVKLEKEGETYRAQTLFMKSVSSLDEKKLLGFHHQICLDSSIIDNYVGRAIKAIRKTSSTNDVLTYLEKISLANKRIIATAQFATKANFASGTRKENTDIPAFFEQYILNVAKDFIATGLKLNVVNDIQEPFEIKARRIELSMIIDNIISNSMKAHAKKLDIIIKMENKNSMSVAFLDNGRGLASGIKNVEDIFDMGVTSTSGSGLGLFQVRQIIESLDGKVSVHPKKGKGIEINMEFIR